MRRYVFAGYLGIAMGCNTADLIVSPSFQPPDSCADGGGFCSGDAAPDVAADGSKEGGADAGRDTSTDAPGIDAALDAPDAPDARD